MYLSPRHLANTELEQDSLSFAERITNIVSTFLDQQKQQTKNVFFLPLPPIFQTPIFLPPITGERFTVSGQDPPSPPLPSILILMLARAGASAR